MKRILLSAIGVYQKLRPVYHIFNLFGFYGGCRFYPSCSDYSITAIEKSGLVKGLVKSFFRIIRCAPWSRGGVDLPQVL